MSFKAKYEETDGPKNGTWNQYSDWKWFIMKETLVSPNCSNDVSSFKYSPQL